MDALTRIMRRTPCPRVGYWSRSRVAFAGTRPRPGTISSKTSATYRQVPAAVVALKSTITATLPFWTTARFGITTARRIRS